MKLGENMNSFYREKKKVVTRMAPSPTGHLHIGTSRTALVNYLFAKQNKGIFIMRSEDTDSERSTKEYEDEILEGLEWLGLSWDSFYRQSERTETYRSYLRKAIEGGAAYLSKEESKRAPGTEIEVVRLKNPNTSITFEDLVRGEITFDTTELGDFVIARSLDDPLYHFTVVVDDHEMEVSHVIRGEDHISNTPRQILIQEAIGAKRPIYAHLPLILAKDRSKLSKRHGAVSLNEYKNEGYLSEAMTNYLALLGWNPGTDQEIFTLDALVDTYDLGGVQKGGAIFDIEKLRWINKEHLLSLNYEQFVSFVSLWLPKDIEALDQFDEERLHRLIPSIRERIANGKDIGDAAKEGEYDFAFSTPHIEPEMLKWKNDASVKDALPRLQKAAELISTLDDDATVEEIKERLWHYAEEVGKGELLWPLRIALSGRERSADPFTIIFIVGPAESYKRVQHACDTILHA